MDKNLSGSDLNEKLARRRYTSDEGGREYEDTYGSGDSDQRRYKHDARNQSSLEKGTFTFLFTNEITGNTVHLLFMFGHS